jgi:uncharacterized protein YdgA (DUF945 family)
MSGKTKIVGLLAVAAVAWVGSTAYIGSKTEPYLGHYVQKTNQMYAQHGMKLSVEKFNKGFFTSKAALKLDFTNPEMKEQLAGLVKLPIDINYTIENGPILFQNGLGLGSSRIVNSIKVSDYLVEKEAFLEVVKNDIIVDSHTNIGFTNNASFEAHTNQIVVDEAGDKLTMTPLLINGDMNIETFQGDMELFIKQFDIKGEYDDIHIQDITLDGTITKFYENGFYLGDFKLDIPSLNMKTEDMPFEVKKANVAMEMSIDENSQKDIDIQFNIQGDLGETQLPTEFAYLKQLEVGYALNGTKLEGLLAFQDYSKRVQAKQEELMEKLTTNTSGTFDENAFAELNQFQQDIENEMILLLTGLLNKNRTEFLFNAKVMDAKAKEASVGLNLKYVGDEVFPKSAAEIREKFEKEFLELLAMNVDVQLNKEYIENLPAELKQELSSQLQMGAMFGVIKDNNTSFSFEADYQPKTLMVNGNDRSEMLKMLEMGMGGQGF